MRTVQAKLPQAHEGKLDILGLPEFGHGSLVALVSRKPTHEERPEYIWNVVQGIAHCSGCEGEKLKTMARCLRVSRQCCRAHDGETEKASVAKSGCSPTRLPTTALDRISEIRVHENYRLLSSIRCRDWNTSSTHSGLKHDWSMAMIQISMASQVDINMRYWLG